MNRQAKKVYKILVWFFSAVIAAGTLTGCGAYGPPESYNAPQKNSKVVIHKVNDSIQKTGKTWQRL